MTTVRKDRTQWELEALHDIEDGSLRVRKGEALRCSTALFVQYYLFGLVKVIGDDAQFLRW